MKNTKHRLVTAFTALALTACTAVADSTVLFSANAGQQLGQVNFDEGVGLPWHIVESEPAEMDFNIENGVYSVEIISPGGASRGGEDRWDCQFRHRGLKITAGHQYQVSYQITATNSGKYYTKIGNLDGDVEIWHNTMSDNGPDFNSSWDLIQISANQTSTVNLTFTANQSMDVAEWAFHLGGDGQYTNGDCFPSGTVITFDNMSLIDLTSDENDYKEPEKWQRAEILTNQVGYFTDCTKQATLLSDDSKSIDFDVIDSNGNSVYSGKSEPFGYDEDSGDSVHIIDFSSLKNEGTFYIETESGQKSREFKVGGSEMYSSMLYDALNYFYQNRSGIPIESKYISSGDTASLARSAGHTSDMAEIENTWGYSGSSGTIDVTGGWYDAGDHGKYVVNGGLSLWLMQNQYETALKYGFEDKYADGTMLLPECSNNFPDLLDEARYEMEWLFKMVVADGEYKGMAYHKAHDEKWTALGIAPADDPMKRIVKPPTTTATLNLSACASQSARLWKDLDPQFAEKCLETAKTAYESALRHPNMYAPLDESIGGGAYGDDNAEDEFYWASCELFITTGEQKYYDDMKKSPYFMKVPQTLGGGENVDTVGSFDWGSTSALGTLSILLNENSADKKDYQTALESITDTAEHYLDIEYNQGYGLPYGQSTIAYNDGEKGYQWGSNSFVTDNSIVLAYAYLLTDNTDYLNGAVCGMDYILGRNPMDYSYVTGYGTHTVEYPHHRYWANQIYSNFPKAPCGVMSGGPNSGMQDPWVRGSGWKKGQISPQKCYLDNIEAWSVNECTINWNSSLAWIAGFLAEENGGIIAGSTGNLSGVSNDNNENSTESTENTPNSESTEKGLGSLFKSDRKESEQTQKASRSRSRENSQSTDSDEGSSGSTLNTAIIAGAIIAGLVSVEVFVYKMVKLKKK